jgi:hypothetical protein
MMFKRLFKRFLYSQKNTGVIVRRFYAVQIPLVAGAGPTLANFQTRRGEFFFCTGVSYSTDNVAPVTPPIFNFSITPTDTIGARRLVNLINSEFSSLSNVSTPGPVSGGPGNPAFMLPVDELFSPQQVINIQAIHQGGPNYTLDMVYHGFAVELGTLEENL